jgi:hypothetical protein
MKPYYSGVRDRLRCVEGTFDFHQCGRCGSIALHPFPDDEETGSFYPETYMVREPTPGKGIAGMLQSFIWHALYLSVYRSDAQAVMRMTGLRHGKLLDIGCGSGFPLREIAKMSDFEVRGLDPDQPAVDYARQHLGQSVTCMTLREAAFPPNSFDVVILFNVLEHLADPRALLQEIARILRPGGYVVLKTQFIDSIQGRIFAARWFNVSEAPRHLFLPSTQGMAELSRMSGMKLVDQMPGSILENSVHVALSILPTATSHIACGEGGRSNRVLRFIGFGLGLAAIPFAFLERAIGKSGTRIYLVQKDGMAEPLTS